MKKKMIIYILTILCFKLMASETIFVATPFGVKQRGIGAGASIFHVGIEEIENDVVLKVMMGTSHHKDFSKHVVHYYKRSF